MGETASHCIRDTILNSPRHADPTLEETYEIEQGRTKGAVVGLVHANLAILRRVVPVPGCNVRNLGVPDECEIASGPAMDLTIYAA